jgi:hypothetical protein
MSMSFLEGLTAQLVLAAGIFPSIYKLFAWVEDRTSPEARRDISSWLKRIHVPGAALAVSNNIVDAFNTLYGTKQFSVKCIFRVVLLATVSIALAMLLLGIWKDIFPIPFQCPKDEPNCIPPPPITLSPSWSLLVSVIEVFLFLTFP